MNILYLRVIYWFNLKSGGSVGHTSGVINEMDKLCNLEVVSNDKLADVKKKIKIEKPVKLKLIPKFINELLYSFKIIFKLKGVENSDVIYQRYSGYSFAGAYLSKKYDIPFVLEFNSSKIWTLQNWSSDEKNWKTILKNIYINLFILPIVKIVENYNLKNSSIIVVVSRVLKDMLIERGINSEKILVNPNGVDVKKFNPDIDGLEIRKKYGINDEYLYGFIGTFGPWHGVEELAEAIVKFYQKYSERVKNSKFLLIGDGMLMKNVKEIIEKSPYSKNVIFTGRIKQKDGPKYLAACDCLLSPHVPNSDGTPFFGSPTKLFEYMGMGKLIIASNLEQIGDILEDGIDSLLVKPGDVNELVEAMEKVIKNPDLYKEYGKNARYKVVKNYTWHKHVLNIIEKIADVTN